MLKYVINGSREIERSFYDPIKKENNWKNKENSRGFIFVLCRSPKSEKRKKCKIISEVLVDTNESS